ncbi:MAG: DUF1772 domain-containing protein [Deltaproteobacteria bacterium]|nr:DUF1772 domain-containing protein [Deltaproteobacteria bacterium]
MTYFQFLATLTANLFTGAAIYINLAEHPARMECGTKLAATVFGPSYKRAAKMQVILALLATGAGAVSWWLGGELMWLIGTLIIFAVVPFTLIAIGPTNKKLLDPGLDPDAESTRILLKNWGKLHAVRSILSLAASIIFLALVV